MVWFFAFFSLGLACVAVGFVVGVNHGLDREEPTMSDYHDTYNDPIDVYIPVAVRPGVYDVVERGDLDG